MGFKYIAMPHKSLLKFCLALLLFLTENDILAQNGLKLIGSRRYVTTFTQGRGRHLVDTIVVPPNHLLKIENASAAFLRNNSMLEPFAAYAIEVADVLIYMQDVTKNSCCFEPHQKSSFPFWLEPGTHYVTFTILLQPGSFTIKQSIHGLLFENI
jgi:hypothetical protein